MDQRSFQPPPVMRRWAAEQWGAACTAISNCAGSAPRNLRGATMPAPPVHARSVPEIGSSMRKRITSNEQDH
jgi:hypothetical protein